MKTGKEEIMRLVFLLAACASIALVAMICVFLFGNGLPTIGKIGVTEFFLGETWRPNNDLYGILPMILGSAYVTLGAIVVGVPIGILTAVFMARFCPDSIYRFLKPAVELLAGIPSVVYGFFGLVVMVPFIRDNIGGTGSSMLTASLLLGMMILPTLISVAEAALRAVPNSYYEGALATWRRACTQRIFYDCAGCQIRHYGGYILGLGRAVGETMAVIMVAGNQARMPQGLLEGVRTMTTNIVIEMGYAADMHRDALIATAVVLFIFILIINLTFSYLKGKVVQQ